MIVVTLAMAVAGVLGVTLQPARAQADAVIDLALGQLVNGTLHVIGNAGWELYPTPTATPPPRAVTILNIVVTGPR